MVKKVNTVVTAAAPQPPYSDCCVPKNSRGVMARARLLV